jgi:hypothetical protein
VNTSAPAQCRKAAGKKKGLATCTQWQAARPAKKSRLLNQDTAGNMPITHLHLQ